MIVQTRTFRNSNGQVLNQDYVGTLEIRAVTEENALTLQKLHDFIMSHGVESLLDQFQKRTDPPENG